MTKELNEAQKTVKITLTLSGLDHEWLDAFARVTDKTFDEAASKGLSRWLTGEGWTFIEATLKRHNGRLLQKESKRRGGKVLGMVIAFPSTAVR